MFIATASFQTGGGGRRLQRHTIWAACMRLNLWDDVLPETCLTADLTNGWGCLSDNFCIKWLSVAIRVGLGSDNAAEGAKPEVCCLASASRLSSNQVLVCFFHPNFSSTPLAHRTWLQKFPLPGTTGETGIGALRFSVGANCIRWLCGVT